MSAELRSTEMERAMAAFILDELGCDGSMHSLIGARPVALSAVLDSARLLELVSWCEDSFGVSIDDAELTEANFRSVSALAALVNTKLADGVT